MNIKDYIENYDEWKQKEPGIKIYRNKNYQVQFRLDEKDIVITEKAQGSIGLSNGISLYIPIEEMENIYLYLKQFFEN